MSPSTAVAVAPAARPETPCTIFSTLASLHSRLPQGDDIGSILHPLSDNAALQLERADFEAALRDLRSAAQSFRSAAAVALSSTSSNAPSTTTSIIDTSPVDAVAAERFRSLLRERASHLGYVDDVVDTLCSHVASQSVHLSKRTLATPLKFLPSELLIGALATPPAPAPRDQPAALSLASALVASLDVIARSLSLETFIDEPLASGGSGPGFTTSHTHSHTLTLGGRLFAIDIEVALSIETAPDVPVYSPSIKVKLSYVAEAGAEGANGSTSHKGARVAELLEGDVRALAELLFTGRVSSRRDPYTGGPGHETQHPATLALAHLSRFSTSLTDLARIDACSAYSESPSTAPDSAAGYCDLFNAMEKLSEAVQSVARWECGDRDLESLTGSDLRDTLDRGHGICVSSATRPYASIVYNASEKLIGDGGAHLLRHLNEQSLSPTDRFAHVLHFSIAPSTHVTNSAPSSPSWIALREGAPDMPSLSSLPLPLHYIARLSPPLPMPRSGARRLAAVLGLPITALTRQDGSVTHTAATATFASLFRIPDTTKSSEMTVKLTIPPRGSELQQPLLVSSLPFRSLEALHQAVEILRSQAMLNALLAVRSDVVTASKGATLMNGEENALDLDALLSSGQAPRADLAFTYSESSPIGLAISMPLQLPAGSAHLRASLRPNQSEESGWQLLASVELLIGPRKEKIVLEPNDADEAVRAALHQKEQERGEGMVKLTMWLYEWGRRLGAQWGEMGATTMTDGDGDISMFEATPHALRLQQRTDAFESKRSNVVASASSGAVGLSSPTNKSSARRERPPPLTLEADALLDGESKGASTSATDPKSSASLLAAPLSGGSSVIDTPTSVTPTSARPGSARRMSSRRKSGTGDAASIASPTAEGTASGLRRRSGGSESGKKRLRTPSHGSGVGEVEVEGPPTTIRRTSLRNKSRSASPKE